MGLVLWPAALVVFLVWSLVAWLLYSMSDWVAGVVGSALSGVLTADLGPWAEWVLASLGNIIQGGVAVAWAVVGLVILSAPVWLRRMTGGERAYAGGGFEDRLDRGDRWVGRAERDGGGYGGRREDPDQRRRSGGFDLDRLRHMAGDLTGKYGKYGKRKRKKRDRDDDDD